MVDTLVGSSLPNLKELRPGSRGRSELRLLFVFDPRREAVAGFHLGELRKLVGKTQAEVAALVGVSQSRISQIENGDIEAMGLETLRAYAAALGGTSTSQSASARTPSKSLEYQTVTTRRRPCREHCPCGSFHREVHGGPWGSLIQYPVRDAPGATRESGRPSQAMFDLNDQALPVVGDYAAHRPADLPTR